MKATQQRMTDVAIRIVDMPFLDNVTFAEARAVMSLHYLAGSRYRDNFQAIMSHPKVQDGITDQEAKVISVLRTPAHYKPENIPHYLEGLDGTGGVYLEERTIQLPLSGATLLTIVRTQDRTTASMGYLEHAVSFAEKLMAAPLPTNYVALYFGDLGPRYGANNWWTHMAIRQSGDGLEEYARTVAHEVGHYYIRSPGPQWISEGATNIIHILAEYERTGLPLETHLKNRPCDSSVKTLAATELLEDSSCARNLGERFWLDLYQTLGEDTFLQGFRALYRMRLVDNPDDDCFECTELTLRHVEAAFKDGASAEVIAKVDVVINRWYYGKEPPSLAERINALPWLADGVTEDERRAVNALRNILQESPAVAETLLGFPWLADGVTEHESWGVHHLRTISLRDRAVAETLLGFPWLADSVTRDEENAIYYFWRILRKDPAMANTLMGSPWFSDGVSLNDGQTLWGLRNLYDMDRGSLSALTTKSWFKDGLSYEEFRLVGDLGGIASRSGTDALAIIGMPFLETFEPADALAVSSLRQLTWCDDGQYDFSMDCSDNGSGYQRVSKKFRQVMSHPTISDGIDDEEAKIVATLFSARLYNPDIFDQLLAPGTVTMMEEKTINLPHSGETQLTIIRIRPGVERTMDLLERAVRTVEGFMATPLPVRHVIFLAEDTLHGAGNWFINMTGQQEIFDTDESSELRALHVLAHETAHYYWYYDWNRHWVAEGLATFFQSLQRRQANAGPDGEPVVPIWPPHLPPCPLIHGNIAELERLEDAGIITYCSDSLGERLFQDLWRTLGESVFRQGLANLYLTARSGTPVAGCESSKAGMCQVAAAFKAAAPADAATVETVIGRWYDNSEPYDLSHVDASPPNPNLPGGVKIARAYISLDRDRPEETRGVRFSASEIQDQVFLNLDLDSSAAQQVQKLTFTVVEYFEDGFAYKVNDATYTRYGGWTQTSLSFPIGPGSGYTWIVRGDVEPPVWAPGRYWVQVYHEGQKVAEVEFQVTP